MRLPGVAAAGAMAVALWACGSGGGRTWTHSCSFGGGSWRAGETICFRPDTASLQKVRPDRALLIIRYTADADVEKFPIVVEEESPAAGYYACDTRTVSLLPKDRRVANRATLGVFESRDTLRLAAGAVPGWSMTVHPAGEETINGIVSITLDLI